MPYLRPPLLPTVKGTVDYGTAQDFLAARGAYEACEASCNTCAKLARVQHPKNQAGWLVGTCAMKPSPFSFHPEDPMFMPCWESRREDGFTAFARSLPRADGAKPRTAN